MSSGGAVLGNNEWIRSTDQRLPATKVSLRFPPRSRLGPHIHFSSKAVGYYDPVGCIVFKFPLWGRAWRSHPTSPTPASGSTAGRVDLQDFLAQRSWPKDENSSRWPGDFEGRQGTPVLWGAESSGGKSSRVGDKGGRGVGGSVMAGGYTSSLTLPPLPSPWWWWGVPIST